MKNVYRAIVALCFVGAALSLGMEGVYGAAHNCCDVSSYVWSEIDHETSPPHPYDRGGGLHTKSGGGFYPPMRIITHATSNVTWGADGSSSVTKRKYELDAHSVMGLKVKTFCEGWGYRWKAGGKFRGRVWAEAESGLLHQAWGASSAGQDWDQDLDDAESQQINIDTNGDGTALAGGVGASGLSLSWSVTVVGAAKTSGADHAPFTETEDSSGAGGIVQVKWTGKTQVSTGADAIQYPCICGDTFNNTTSLAYGRATAGPRGYLILEIECVDSIRYGNVYGIPPSGPTVPKLRRTEVTTGGGTQADPEVPLPLVELGGNPGAKPLDPTPNRAGGYWEPAPGEGGSPTHP